MIGTLTITGPLADLAKVAQFAEKLAGVSATVDLPEYGGWSVGAMASLLRRLAPNQRDLIDMLIVGNGAVTGDQLRAAFGDDLRGLTGPISRHIGAMVAEGMIAEDAVPIAVAERDARDRANQRTSFIRTPTQLVDILRAAVDSAR